MTEQPILDRMPPHSNDAEKAVLGSLLRDNACIDEVRLLLHADSFYPDAHQKLFAAILDVWDASKPVDLVTLFQELVDRRQAEDIGGAAKIAELWDVAPTAANALYYANIVRAFSMRRRLIGVSTEILRDAYDSTDSPEGMIEDAERKIFALSEMNADLRIYTAAEAVNDAFDRLQKRIDARKAGNITGVPSGFSKLDALTGGFQPSELTIIAARTSIGKTAFIGSIALHATMEKAVPTFFASLEQSRHELMERFACNLSGVESLDVRNADLSDDDLKRLRFAGDAFRGAPFWVDDCSSQNLPRISANARRLRRRQQLGLVLIDYFQLIAYEDRRGSQFEQLGIISRGLKRLARELEIPVVVLAQLNRNVESRGDPRPRMSDIRGSGEIEQDADVIILLHRESKDAPQLEIMLEKQRNGPTGVLKLDFDKRFFRFTDARDDYRTPFEDV